MKASKTMQEKNLRNMRIYNLFTYSKVKKAHLAKQFNLSVTRINQIIEKEKRLHIKAMQRIERHKYSVMMLCFRNNKNES